MFWQCFVIQVISWLKWIRERVRERKSRYRLIVYNNGIQWEITKQLITKTLIQRSLVMFPIWFTIISWADKGSNLAFFCKIGTMAEIFCSIRYMYEEHRNAWRQLVMAPNSTKPHYLNVCSFVWNLGYVCLYVIMYYKCMQALMSCHGMFLSKLSQHLMVASACGQKYEELLGGRGL